MMTREEIRDNVGAFVIYNRTDGISFEAKLLAARGALARIRYEWNGRTWTRWVSRHRLALEQSEAN